ncbi:MAG: glycosyl hydrolase [Fidelibacterota bacterium]
MREMNLLLILLLVMVVSHCGNKKHTLEPVNPKATDEAKALLNFLYDIEGEYVLSGHHNYQWSDGKFSDQVKEMTGKYPVVIGSDFSFNFKENDHRKARQAMIDGAIENYKKGHIITLMWHSAPPEFGHTSTGKDIWIWQPGKSDEYWQELTTPGTELNDQWKVQVDEISRYMKQLQDNDIPVLWRPYHEMNGIWFWWCNKRGPEGFQKLWKMMYDRMVNHHNLNNLIWVWNPNAPRDKENDEAYAYELFYPGNDYVDVLAADVYHNDYKQSHHDDLLALGKGKVISLGEVGKMPSPEILEEQPKWTWFMGWANWLTKANEPEDVKALYNSPRVITLDEIKRNKDGSYTITIEK